MSTRRVVLAVGVLVAGLGIAWWLRSDREPPGPDRERAAEAPERGRPSTRATSTPAPSPDDSTPAVAAAKTPVDEFAERLSGGDAEAVRAAAAELRRRARTDDAAWRDLAARLLDPATPEKLREALAFVAGTIDSPRTDPLLLDALAQFGATPEFARAALLALGARRTPPDEDEVFGMGERPWGAEGPGGLGITVRRDISDAATRAAISGRLAREESIVRRAATVSLRHSLAASDARTAFVDALSSETSDVVAQELGESLVQAARSVEPTERSRVLGLVLRRAADEPLDGLRFRIEDDLQSTPLTDADRRALVALAGPAHPYARRAFAMTVLSGAAKAGGDAAVREARAVLVAALADADPPTRDLAARLFARLPSDPATDATLARLAHDDPEWNVRYTALETLAAVAPPHVARRAITAAVEDPEKRVVSKARGREARRGGGRSRSSRAGDERQ
jgi:hypothetical protein